jgi:hypothetical protein
MADAMPSRSADGSDLKRFDCTRPVLLITVDRKSLTLLAGAATNMISENAGAPFPCNFVARTVVSAVQFQGQFAQSDSDRLKQPAERQHSVPEC